jgi:hypothetical protein
MKNAHRMQKIARNIERIAPGMGFFVMVFPHKEPDCDYCSNCKREDVLNMMKDFIIKNGAHEDWISNLLSEEKIRDAIRASGNHA